MSASDGTNNQSGTYTLVPKITITPKSILHTKPSSTPITVTGTGFAGESVITITFNGTTQITSPSTITTNAGQGNFSATFTVPQGMTMGSYIVQASDTQSNIATAIFNIN